MSLMAEKKNKQINVNKKDLNEIKREALACNLRKMP